MSDVGDGCYDNEFPSASSNNNNSNSNRRNSNGNASVSSSQTLLRLQKETDRVKKRLLKEQQEQQERYDSHAAAAQQHQLQLERQRLSAKVPSETYLIIEKTESAHFEDPVPANQMSTHLKSKHEAFKARLIDDVLGAKADDKVPMEKVVMLIWQFRDDPQVVKFMTKFVAKYAGSRHVFEGIEFYLPQLAHMIIHLEAEWDDAILERFALVIAQQSLHFALQLNWILQGAIEDYQPELPSGEENPNFNFLFYSRCIKLLTNMERCVVYKRPRSQELQRLYENGKITKAEYQTLEQADRRFAALQITQENDGDDDSGFGGFLLYKRPFRTSCLKAKPWKQRYFCVEARMLNCYDAQNNGNRRLIRSMPLEGARIEEERSAKYPYTFCVVNRSFEFRMRASSQEDMNKWIQILRDEASSMSIFGRPDKARNRTTTDNDQQLIQDMTPAQRARYEFFRDERNFIRRVTDIAEELRFKDRTERKKLAPGLVRDIHMPPCVYIPLCGSTDIWRRLTGTFYRDTRVFNTNERCPIIMYFLAARGEVMEKRINMHNNPNLDVADYLHKRFDLNDEDNDKTIEEEGNQEESKYFDAVDDTVESINGNGQSHISTGTHGPPTDRSEATEGSSVWHDNVQNSDNEHGQSSGSGNRRLQGFLKESWTSIPRKLASRIEGNRRPSVLDNAVDLQTIPILEGIREHGDDDEVSMGGSSIVSKNKIVLGGEQDRGDIDLESLNRAKQIVSGGESWGEKSLRMLEESADRPANAQYEVVSLMSKSNDDLRQEVFVMQMIHYYKSVFAKAKLPLWLKTYRILSTSSSTGLIEVLVDATSIDGLKKAEGYPAEGGMRRYFEETYGGPDSRSFKAAQQNFMQSLAAYALVSYLLGLKDRHNGNIMIDTKGHLIFIDFGFAMGMAPGHEFSMERAPFKFTDEYAEVMGGVGSECYKEFERLFVEGFKQARANSQIALGLVEIMMYKSNYPCFSGWRYGNGVALRKFEQRLMLNVPDNEIDRRARRLIASAKGHGGTKLYDSFQKWSNGYAI